MVIEDLKQRIREIPDFPKPGILFRDITPLLSDGQAFRQAIDFIGGRFLDRKIDIVVGVEARGFIMGSALAYKLGAGNALVGNRENCPSRPTDPPTPLSTEPIRSRSTKMPSERASASSLQTISWRPEGRSRRQRIWCANWAARSWRRRF